MIEMSTKFRPSVFATILLVLSAAVLATTVWQTFRVNKLQTDVAKLQLLLQMRAVPYHAAK